MKSCRPFLGTYVEIRIDHDDPAVMADALAAGFSAIERVHRCMSVFAADSDIGRINRLPIGATLAVDPWTAEVLALAMDLYAASDGLFDCGIAPQLAAWGMLPESARGNPASSIRQVRLSGARRVSIAGPVRLDLGGIAKGFAVDRATEAMVAAGAAGGLINAGGDLRVFGGAEEAIYLRDPGDPGQLRYAGRLRDGACATSATYYSRRDNAGYEVSALVDPRNRQALRTRRSYSVIAPHCAIADALTKVLAISGSAELPCYSRYDAHAIILEPAGEAP